jgi:hypothetical protein
VQLLTTTAAAVTMTMTTTKTTTTTTTPCRRCAQPKLVLVRARPAWRQWSQSAHCTCGWLCSPRARA